MVRNGAATFPDTGLFAPLSPFYNNGWFVREIQARVAPNPPQGVLVRGHAGLVINKFPLRVVKGPYRVRTVSPNPHGGEV